MNSFAFLLMLGIFAALAYWYILNHEAESDGEEGFMGLKPDSDTPLDALGKKLAGNRKAGVRAVLNRVRGRVTDTPGETPSASYNARHKPSAERIRERTVEKDMEEEVEELEANRKRYNSPRTGHVRSHVDLSEQPRPRSPFGRDRGVRPQQPDVSEKIRMAKLEIHPSEEELALKALEEQAGQAEPEKPAKKKSYRIRESMRKPGSA